MKTLLKWVSAALVLLAIAAVVLLVLGSRQLSAGPAGSSHSVVVSTDSITLSEGNRLLSVYGCRTCHGDDLAGTDFIVGMPFMNLPAPNLTGSAFTVEELEGAIRHGRRADGGPLVIMPSEALAHLSDLETGAMISYLMTLPRIERSLVARSVGPIGRVAAAFGADALLPHRKIDQGRSHPTLPPDEGYGMYLSTFCGVCHGQDMTGAMVEFNSEPSWAPNLTADAGTGLGAWSFEEFQRAVQGGVLPTGESIDPELMPWPGLAALTQSEMQAIWDYLRGLDSVESGDPRAAEAS